MNKETYNNATKIIKEIENKKSFIYEIQNDNRYIKLSIINCDGYVYETDFASEEIEKLIIQKWQEELEQLEKELEEL